MLPRIETKNLIAPCLKKCVRKITFDNAYIPGWLFTLSKTFHRIKKYVISIVF